MLQLIDDFDKRLIISTKDKKTMQDRHTFVESFMEMIPKIHHHRRCVTGIRNHKALRESAVVDALQKAPSKKELQEKFRCLSEKYKEKYEKSPLKQSSVLARVIEDTKLYFLIEWEKTEWIYSVLSIEKKSNTGDQ